MTLTEISRYFHLNETIQKNREALKFLRERAEPAAPSLNGMPHASGVKDSTGRLAVEIADMDARITYLEEQAEQERDKAVAFCSTIQDARLYLIFRLRFVRCLTWAEVADLLGTTTPRRVSAAWPTTTLPRLKKRSPPPRVHDPR